MAIIISRWEGPKDMGMKRTMRLVGLFALCGWVTPAFAYIDPGAGMVVWQGLLALIGAVAVFARRPWQALRRWVTGQRADDERP